MNLDAWFTLAVVLGCFTTLAWNRIAPDITMMAGLGVLLIVGVISPEQALAGLSNEGMVTVAVLYVVVTGIKETGGLAWIVEYILGKPRTLTKAQIKLMAPVALISAFLNNTPVVALYVPAVQDWAKRHQLSVSKLMIPLSYASIAGGTCTLIGTSTNLVVNGMLTTETNGDSLSMFELAWIGIPVTLLVFVYVLLTSRWLLPERVPAITKFGDVREYTVELMVGSDSPLDGRTIEEAGLRQLPGLYLIEIEREGRFITAVSPQQLLQEYDRLVFTGVVESIVDLQKIKGLEPISEEQVSQDTPRHHLCLTEVVVSNKCPLAGKSIRAGKFRTIYDAAVIAVARNGERVAKKVGDIVLRAGDTLLLETRPSFAERQRNSSDFLLVSRLSNSSVPRHDRSWLAGSILILMIILVSTGILSLLKGAILAAGLMLITRCTTGRIARRAIDWQVLIVIAASFGIGSAMQTSGAAAAIAETLASTVQDDPFIALAMIYTVTAVLSSMVTNNVAAVLIFPIALAISQSLQVSFLPFVVTIMIAASTSFATPIGYQTNLMVYGVGGYRFSDFVRFGLPLTVLVGILTVMVVPLTWPF